MITCILALLFSNPITCVETVEYVDLIELNHYYDSKARLVFEQVIFWDRSPMNGRFQVRAWCMVEDRDLHNRRPVKNEANRLYCVEWQDKEQGMQRRITSRLYRESWTHHDPERDDKAKHEDCLRVGFAKRITVKAEATE